MWADQIRLVDESKVTLNREKLRRYVIGAKEMVKIPHHDATDDATGIFTALTNRMESSVDNLATVQDLENAICEMYTGIISFMSNTVLDNLSAYDLSFLVDNSVGIVPRLTCSFSRMRYVILRQRLTFIKR